MPCRTYDDDSEVNIQQYVSAADAATRAACDMRTILRRAGFEHELTLETRSWIHQHDEADLIRIQQGIANGVRAQTRQRGLDKLTLEERRALGL